jgi:hypothetical protein
MTADVERYVVESIPVAPTIPRAKEREAFVDASLLPTQTSEQHLMPDNHNPFISHRGKLQVGERVVFKSVLGHYCPAVITGVHTACTGYCYSEDCRQCIVHYKLVYMDISLPVPAVVRCTYDVELRGRNIMKSWQDSYWCQPHHRGRYSYMRQCTDDLTQSVTQVSVS